MFKLTDRLLIYSYVKSYLICFVSLLGLYIVVDLFTNIDEFAQAETELLRLLQHIGAFYGVQITLIFDRLSEAIVLLAAMFTVAWMQRNNELLPLLSAGVSTRRVLQPVLLAACALVFVNVANQEVLIPIVGNFRVERGDPGNEKALMVNGTYDSNDVHVCGREAIFKEQCIEEMTCVLPPEAANGQLIHVYAKRAHYIPPGNKPRTGGWLLTDAEPPELFNWNRKDILEPIVPGQYFLYTAELDFGRLTRNNRKWFQSQSTWAVFRELSTSDPATLSSMAVFFHMRLTRPLLGMILVIMGLSVILQDQNRNVFISAGLCLMLCAIFFAASVVARYLGDNEYLSPALAAWLPVLIFGPLAFVLFDAVHT